MDSPPTPVTPMNHRLRRRRWLSIFLGAIILTCGMVIGSVITVSYLWNRVLDHIQNPDQIPARITERLERRLDLTADQAQAIQEILTERQNGLLAIRAQVYPQVQAELNRARDEVAAVLNDAQADQWRKMFENLRHKLTMPPPGAQATP
ncbi:MAG: hypothetical protein IT368_09045 [Candidatus Hydrogenedentes bacterium]|nr:hypothetical protein [Candidatus Hydrogenedentota bacterium]